MNLTNENFYNKNAKNYIEKTGNIQEQSLYKYFEEELPKKTGLNILDLGSG